jgi:hypothetical protein
MPSAPPPDVGWFRNSLTVALSGVALAGIPDSVWTLRARMCGWKSQANCSGFARWSVSMALGIRAELATFVVGGQHRRCPRSG